MDLDPAHDDRIRRGWKAGKSAHEIAKRIPGATRETVLDRLRALGMVDVLPQPATLDRAGRIAALTNIRKTDNPLGRKGRRWPPAGGRR